MSQEVFHSLSKIIAEKLTYQTLLDREPPIKTGFTKLDACMNGGITPGLIVLGAGPGVGKSTFCLQLAEQVAREEKVPVLYFSLEMTRERVAAKAITLDNFRAQKAAGADPNTLSDADAAKKVLFTAAELFNPEDLRNMSEEKQTQYLQAQARVSENENLQIIDSPLCARQIVETVERFMKETAPAEGQSKKPLVIVDYLQILPPDPTTHVPATDKQQVDLNLKVLRELILKDIPVILISSLSRGNYSGAQTRSMKADAFKETGGIEYSADVLMGLQFSACHNPGGCNPDEEKGKYPRKAEIIILKQRYGGADIRIPLHYYAQFDYMEETSEQTPPVQQQPEKKAEESPASAPEPPAASKFTSAPEPPAASKPQATQKKTGEQSKKAPEEQPDTQSDAQEKSPAVYMNNTKVAYQIRNGQWKPGKTFHCNVATSKNDSVITTFTLEKESDEIGTLTAYDCEVADAVYTLHHSDPSGFTLRQLLYILTGDKNQTLTEQKKDELEQSLRRLMNTTITITCTEEMVKMRKKPELLTDGVAVFSGKFANIKESDAKKGRYQFLSEADTHVMPLYSYGESTTQMIKIPLALVAARSKTGGKVPDTQDNILIKHYLIRRLEVIRKGITKAPHMLQVNYFNQSAKGTSGLLALTGIRREKYSGADWTKKLKQTEKTVTAILDSFRDYGYITGYESQEHVGVTLPKKVNNPFRLPEKNGSNL